MKILENMWKFTETDANIEDSLVYKTMKSANEGNLKEFKKMYKELSKQSFGRDYIIKGYYKLMGYEFNFRPYLKKFLILQRYSDKYEIVYALNKTNIFDSIYYNRYNVLDIIEDNRR